VLEIQVDLAKGCTICRPVGELDAFTVSQFRQALAELASSPRLLIDLAGVPFVDSARKRSSATSLCGATPAFLRNASIFDRWLTATKVPRIARPSVPPTWKIVANTPDA